MGPYYKSDQFEFFFGVSHGPREWDKTLAKNIWKLFFVRPILGHPNPSHPVLVTDMLVAWSQNRG